MVKKALFIAATGQNVGKTTICLGILAALHKRFTEIGFIKPIGQQHVKISENLKVDKDVILFKEYFSLNTEYADMSPIILPSGFTKDFLDDKISAQFIEESIQTAFKKIYFQNSITLVEGTGHVGVGSIVQMNNAQVAALLDLEMIIIVSGGLGSAIDELALNIAMCKIYGVKIRGVILNRVLEDKRQMIENYFPKALRMWDIPLIGCIPYDSFLNAPTLKDYETLFQTSLIAGQKYYQSHFQRSRLVAGSLDAYREEVERDELIITPATREDIINETIQNKERLTTSNQDSPIFGMILTGIHAPSEAILNAIREAELPTLYAPLCSYDAMKMITHFIAKIRLEDVPKIKKAIQLVEENIDMDLLLQS